MANKADKPDEKSLEEIGVYIAPKVRAAKYSNAIQLNVSVADVALNFVYVNPDDEPQGTLVSRVVIPHDQAEKLSEALVKALKVAKDNSIDTY